MMLTEIYIKDHRLFAIMKIRRNNKQSSDLDPVKNIAFTKLPGHPYSHVRSYYAQTQAFKEAKQMRGLTEQRPSLDNEEMQDNQFNNYNDENNNADLEEEMIDSPQISQRHSEIKRQFCEYSNNEQEASITNTPQGEQIDYKSLVHSIISQARKSLSPSKFTQHSSSPMKEPNTFQNQQDHNYHWSSSSPKAIAKFNSKLVLNKLSPQKKTQSSQSIIQIHPMDGQSSKQITPTKQKLTVQQLLIPSNTILGKNQSHIEQILQKAKLYQKEHHQRIATIEDENKQSSKQLVKPPCDQKACEQKILLESEPPLVVIKGLKNNQEGGGEAQQNFCIRGVKQVQGTRSPTAEVNLRATSKLQKYVLPQIKKETPNHTRNPSQVIEYAGQKQKTEVAGKATQIMTESKQMEAKAQYKEQQKPQVSKLNLDFDPLATNSKHPLLKKGTSLNQNQANHMNFGLGKIGQKQSSTSNQSQNNRRTPQVAGFTAASSSHARSLENQSEDHDTNSITSAGLISPSALNDDSKFGKFPTSMLNVKQIKPSNKHQTEIAKGPKILIEGSSEGNNDKSIEDNIQTPLSANDNFKYFMRAQSIESQKGKKEFSQTTTSFFQQNEKQFAVKPPLFFKQRKQQQDGQNKGNDKNREFMELLLKYAKMAQQSETPNILMLQDENDDKLTMEIEEIFRKGRNLSVMLKEKVQKLATKILSKQNGCGNPPTLNQNSSSESLNIQDSRAQFKLDSRNNKDISNNLTCEEKKQFPYEKYFKKNDAAKAVQNNRKSNGSKNELGLKTMSQTQQMFLPKEQALERGFVQGIDSCKNNNTNAFRSNSRPKQQQQQLSNKFCGNSAPRLEVLNKLSMQKGKVTSNQIKESATQELQRQSSNFSLLSLSSKESQGSAPHHSKEKFLLKNLLSLDSVENFDEKSLKQNLALFQIQRLMEKAMVRHDHSNQNVRVDTTQQKQQSKPYPERTWLPNNKLPAFTKKQSVSKIVTTSGLNNAVTSQQLKTRVKNLYSVEDGKPLAIHSKQPSINATSEQSLTKSPPKQVSQKQSIIQQAYNSPGGLQAEESVNIQLYKRMIQKRAIAKLHSNHFQATSGAVPCIRNLPDLQIDDNIEQKMSELAQFEAVQKHLMGPIAVQKKLLSKQDDPNHIYRKNQLASLNFKIKVPPSKQKELLAVAGGNEQLLQSIVSSNQLQVTINGIVQSDHMETLEKEDKRFSDLCPWDEQNHFD